MAETLNELNNQAIKDGLLLPNGQSYRNDFGKLLGAELSSREQKIYLSILRHFGPITAEELAKEVYPDYFNARLEYEAIQSIWTLISRLKKKLGDMEIVSPNSRGYFSRRQLILSDVAENIKNANNVPLPGIEPGSKD